MNTVNNPQITIQFLGAAETVTGSKYYIKTPTKNILVDCGLFQGLLELQQRNRESLPIAVGDIDIILLTHGHLDHTGYLPKLVKDGFAAQIWGTAPTLQITKIILEDSARIQEEDAARANAKGFSKHNPAVALYDTGDVEKTMPLCYPQPSDVWLEIDKDIHCRFRYNGHIIGATFIELKVGDKVIVFSGDIGRTDDLLMYEPKRPEQAYVVLMESTYGHTIHPDDSATELIRIIKECVAKNGTLIIPSFAVERTQLLMYLLWKLMTAGDIPDVPVYMDSPMGSSVLDVFERNLSWHKLSADDCVNMCKEIKLIQTVQETYKLAQADFSKIIIAGSGMATGGRVLTYMLQYLPNPTATMLLAGYQAEGTRGRDLLDGAKEIKIYGKFFPVRATVESITGLSAHADQGELIAWLSALKTKPANIFLIHGETDALQGLQTKIKDVYNWDATIPKLNEVFTI